MMTLPDLGDDYKFNIIVSKVTVTQTGPTTWTATLTYSRTNQ